MMMIPSKDELDAAVTAIAEQRAVSAAGQRAWDRPGILAALLAVMASRGLSVDQARARGVAAAANPANRTPKSLEWQPDPPTPAKEWDLGPTCSECLRPREVHERANAIVAPQHRHEFRR